MALPAHFELKFSRIWKILYLLSFANKNSFRSIRMAIDQIGKYFSFFLRNRLKRFVESGGFKLRIKNWLHGWAWLMLLLKQALARNTFRSDPLRYTEHGWRWFLGRGHDLSTRGWRRKEERKKERKKRYTSSRDACKSTYYCQSPVSLLDLLALDDLRRPIASCAFPRKFISPGWDAANWTNDMMHRFMSPFKSDRILCLPFSGSIFMLEISRNCYCYCNIVEESLRIFISKTE